MKKVRQLHVILKTAERCNLACSYCYFFFGGDESYKVHSPVIKRETLTRVLDFIHKGCTDLSVEGLNVYFHGGEPLLQKKQDFDEMCDAFRNKLSFLRLDLSVQTNGVLIDEEWVSLFRKHSISVGVSIDGNKKDHDKYRVDHKGRGSYERTKKGLEILKEKSMGKVPFGVLGVINPQSNGREVYHHFVKELEIKSFDSLLPDYHYESAPPPSEISRFTDFLCEVFNAWVEDDDPSVRVRFLSSVMMSLLGRNSGFLNFGAVKPDTAAVTISSDGDLSPDDTLRSTHRNIIHRNAHIDTVTLPQFLEDSIFQELAAAKTDLPKTCQECIYKKICVGGEPINRYKKENGFDNPSIYCEGLKKIYEKAAVYLLQNGAPKEKILGALSF